MTTTGSREPSATKRLFLFWLGRRGRSGRKEPRTGGLPAKDREGNVSYTRQLAGTAACRMLQGRTMHSSLIRSPAERQAKPFATSSGTYALRRIVATEFQEFQVPYVIGIVLSVAVAVFARSVGFDRDRAFYPTVMIVIASYYVLFAAMSGSIQTVLLESIVMTGFAIAAVVGFKSSAWIVVGALAGHGVFDALRGEVLENSGGR